MYIANVPFDYETGLYIKVVMYFSRNLFVIAITRTPSCVREKKQNKKSMKKNILI